MRYSAFSKFAVMFLVSLLWLITPVRTSAQHGHPLADTWSGYWGPSAEQRSRILLLLDYDGNEITGVINPGPTPARITRASLDPETWRVVLEGSREASDGSVVLFLIEGRIENVTSPTTRAIAGSWMEGGERGEFRVTLN